MDSKLFPPVYTPWLASRLAGSVNETLATCDNCAMAKPEGLMRDPGPFEAHLKCCTYFPFVPNFGVGAMLGLKSSAIDLRLKTAGSQGLLLPLGLYATPERQALMALPPEENGFGQREELLCPFFDKTSLGCSVWEQRPGVCTTYFCKSNRGAKGLAFWSDLEKYLNHFEWVMANEVLQRLGIGENEMEMFKAIMTTEEGDMERAYFVEAAWGSWFPRQNEFFLEAARIAPQITSAELNSLLGDEYLALEDSLRARV